MKKLIIILFAFTTACYGQEFNGPFASWNKMPVVADSTDISPLLDSLISIAKVNHKDIYVRHGFYNISKKIDLHHLLDVNFIGEDPRNTTLNWIGSGDVFIDMSGTAYSKVSRFTLIGNGVLYVINQSTIQGQGWFDTGNEYSDLIIKNAWYGINGGANNFGFAETAVNRCVFTDLFKGIKLGNWNALDLWVRNSRFERCSQGVSNYNDYSADAGNFKVYNSIFKNNVDCDLRVQQPGLGEFSFWHNYSTGSPNFLLGWYNNNPAQITIAGNTLLGSNIYLRNQGALLSMNNKYVGIDYKDDNSIGDLISFQDKLNNSTVTPSGRSLVLNKASNETGGEPIMPATPDLIIRKVFEADNINAQSKIDSAVNFYKSIIHFANDANINITIHSGANIQIVGDGDGDNYGTQISGNIVINCPAKVVFRDLNLLAKTVMNNTDQPNGRIYFSQVEFHNNKKGLVLNNLHYTKVLAINSRFSQSDVGIELNNCTNQNIFWSGLFWHNGYNATVSNSNLHIRDYWDEGNYSGTYLKAENSKVTIEGSHLYEGAFASLEQFDIKNSSLTMASNYLSNNVVLKGNNNKFLSIGNTLEQYGFIEDSSSNSTVRSISCRLIDNDANNSGSGSFQSNNVGGIDSSFISDMLTDSRNLDEDTLAENGLNTTDIRFYRCWVYNYLSGNAIEVNGNIATPVQIISFKSQCENNSVKLEWITAQEINADKFLIEGTNDLAHFKALTNVAAWGNSSIQRSYSYDATIYKFYRLSEVDKDGKKQVYEVLVNNCAVNAGFKIYDAAGHYLKSGINFSKQDLKNYPKGIYEVRINNITTRYFNNQL